MHQLISHTTQTELKMKLLEVEGARAPVPHSWRRHWHYSTSICAC